MKFSLPNLSASQRIPGIDLIRGIAALLVTLSHLSMLLKTYPQTQSLLSYGQIGVDMFFVVSGYVIVFTLDKSAYRVKHFFRFLIRRSCRIDPPYILSIFLFLLTFKIFAIYGIRWAGTEFETGKFLAHLFYLVPFTDYPFYSHIYWTLCVEFQFYILIGLLYFLSEDSRFRISFMLIFSSLSLISLPNQGYLVFHYGSIFSIGIALYHYTKTKNIAYLIPLAIALFITYYVFRLALLFCIFTIFAIVVFRNIGKIFQFLGRISYSLYLIHLIVMIPAVEIMSRSPLAKEYELSYFIASLLVTIAVSYGFYLIIERPSVAWSKRIAYQKN